MTGARRSCGLEVTGMQVEATQVFDTEELGMALAYLAGALPCKPRWIALASDDGQLLGQFQGKNDGARIAALVRATAALGPFRCFVMLGADGAWLMLPLGESYRVYVAATNVRSLDAFVAAAREGLLPLRDVLGLSR